MFRIGFQYSKKDLYIILNVPKEKQRGDWDKGYHIHDGNIFIFSNVGIPGRTGHNYNNYWDGELFVWEASTKSHLGQPQIQKMLNPFPDQKIFLFTRTMDRLPFTYEGEIVVKEFKDTTPVQIVWAFEQYPYEAFEEKPLSLLNEDQQFYEGAVTKIFINKYERNPLARRMCIAHHGAFCNVCLFDFHITYGELGDGYIHVHHIIPISSLGKSYVLIPELDLIPVCPNCHCMIHKKSPPINLTDLKNIINQNA